MSTLNKAVVGLLRSRLVTFKSRGNFSPAQFGRDFGIELEISGDRAVAEFSAYTPEGAVFLTELATETRFFQGTRLA